MTAKKTASLKTFAERMKYARATAGLSQGEMARAISNIAKTKTNKSIISLWESGKVKNPHNATMLAIAAVTMFSQTWLVNGTGPEKISLKPAPSGNAAWRRAIIIAANAQKSPEDIADAALQVYETLQDDPTTPEAALKRIAQLSKRK